MDRLASFRASRLLGALLLLAAVLASSPGRADRIVKVRAVALSQGELVNGGEDIGATLAGAHVDVELARRWVGEVGGGALLGLESIGADGYLRVGPGFETSGEQAGTTHMVAVLVGYRYARRPPMDPSDGYDVKDELHALTVHVSYDTTWWIGRRTGLTLRGLVGAEAVIAHEVSPVWEYVGSDPMRWSVDAGLAVGVAFR